MRSVGGRGSGAASEVEACSAWSGAFGLGSHASACVRVGARVSARSGPVRSDSGGWCAFGPRWAMALMANSANQDVWIALRVSKLYTVEIDGPGAWIAREILKPNV